MTDPALTAVETCVHCGGAGQVPAERNFLLARLRYAPDAFWIGRASDAMIHAAITTSAPPERPYDAGDLARCLVTRNVAPEHLRDRMDRIILGWLVVQLQEEQSQFHLLPAREMSAEWTPKVRALLEDA